VNGKSILETSELSIDVKWSDLMLPSFTLEGPVGGVKVTADNNRFSLILNNYQIPDLSILDI
jgi:hypothetical protein